jgi:hypothetical protein
MVAVFPAIMASILLPILAGRHVPDSVLGVGAGFLIGVSLVGLVALARQPKGCA